MGFGLTLQRFLEHFISEPFVALQSVTHGVKDIIEILFFYFTELSLTACYVIPIVVIIRFLIKNNSKSYSYALWGIVYFKLISSFRLDFFNYSLVPQHQIDEIYTTITPNINAFYNPVAGFVSQVQSDFTAPVPVVTPMYIPALVWVLGLSVIVAVSTMMYLSLYFETKNGGIECVYENIYASDTIPTPFVYGVVRPKIFLPKGLTEAQQSYIITHENVHISRGDHIIKLIVFAITCIHWFNPLVWLAFFLMEKDMEMSCDEKVIQLLGSEHKKDYSYCILSLASEKKFLPKGYLSFGDSDTKKRIKNVLGYKKPRFWVGVATVILVSFIALGLIADNNIEYRPDDSTTNNDAVDYTFENVQLLADIYLCDSVYSTDYTLTYGVGSVVLPVQKDCFELKDYRVFLCTDDCAPADIVSRASQGYATAYQVVLDEEFYSDYPIFRFKMIMPDLMENDLKNQGIYDDMVKQMENNHYYLIAVDENHYVYIHFEEKSDFEKNNADFFNTVVKKVTVNINSKSNDEQDDVKKDVNQENIEIIQRMYDSGKSEAEIIEFAKKELISQGIKDEQLRTLANLSFSPVEIYCMEDTARQRFINQTFEQLKADNQPGGANRLLMYEELADKVFLSYKNNSITYNETFEKTPEDFIFPEIIHWGKTEFVQDEMGYYNVNILSKDGKYRMGISIKDFTYDGEYPFDSTPTVNYVAFFND